MLLNAKTFYLPLFGAAVLELAGCDSFWHWRRESGAAWWPLAGIAAFMAYGIVQTIQPENFGRVFAAYGGVFILTALLWGWAKGSKPDGADCVGAGLCIIGSMIIKYWPRT